MKIVNDKERLYYFMKKYQIDEMFDSENLDFRLHCYQKGEQVCSPLNSMDNLLFLVEGSTYLYGLRSDGGYLPVTVHVPFAVYGDMELATGLPSPFFVEAKTDVFCIAISLKDYEQVLRKDISFLNYMLRTLGDKLAYAGTMDITNRSLEERVLFLMETFCEDGCIHSVNDTMMQLRCSRRQLQRVLGRLCEAGRVRKVKKGMYKLL